MSDDRIRRIADKLIEARKSGRLISGETPETGPASIEEAYAVQRLVAEEWGRSGPSRRGLSCRTPHCASLHAGYACYALKAFEP